MKLQLYILTAFITFIIVNSAFAAGSSSTFTPEEDKKEESSFEACGKDSEKGCKKETKKKFQIKKNVSAKPEDQK